MNRDIVLRMMGQLSDEQLMHAFGVATGMHDGGGMMGGTGQQTHELDALSMDPENAPQSWGDLKIVTMGDERPKLSDPAAYSVRKDMQMQKIPGGMPQDHGEGAYDAPGGF